MSVAIKIINIFQSKALQNLPQSYIFGLKINHLATLLGRLTKRICGSVEKKTRVTRLGEFSPIV
jgi:hypothetical protein